MTLLAMHEVDFQYRGATSRALREVSFELLPNRSLGIVGESGSGKTTILSLLLGLASPTSGEVRLEGKALQLRNRADVRRLRHLVQPVFQDPYSSLDPRQRVDRIIAEPLRSLGIQSDPALRRVEVDKALREVGLEPEVATRYPHEFSGGQRQRIAIARALVGSPKVLLADEPVSALDMTTRIEVIALLDRLRTERDLTIVMVSHDLSVVAALCDEVMVLKSGQVIEQGPSLEVMADPKTQATKQLVAAIPKLKTAGS